MPFCQNCGKQNEDQALFCHYCGASLAEGNNTESSPPLAQQDEPASALPRANIRFNRQTVLILAGVVVLVCAYFVFSFLTRPLSPATVATRFMDTLKSGNYARAYGYFDNTALIGNPLLTESFFAQSFQTKKLQDYSIVPSQDSGSDASQPSYETVMNIGGDRREINLSLINKSSQKPQWKIDPSSFITSTQIQAPTGVNVTVNGEPVQLDNGNGSLNTYINCALQFSLADPDIKPVQTQAMAGDNVNLTDVEPSDNLKQQITLLVDNFNQAWINAVKNDDMTPLVPFVQQNSDEWNKINSSIEQFKSNGEHQEAKLDSDSHGQVRFGDSLSVILCDNDETWTSQVVDSSGSISEQQPNQLNQWTYMVEKQSDGSWLIVGSNTR